MRKISVVILLIILCACSPKMGKITVNFLNPPPTRVYTKIYSESENKYYPSDTKTLPYGKYKIQIDPSEFLDRGKFFDVEYTSRISEQRFEIQEESKSIDFEYTKKSFGLFVVISGEERNCKIYLISEKNVISKKMYWIPYKKALNQDCLVKYIVDQKNKRIWALNYSYGYRPEWYLQYISFSELNRVKDGDWILWNSFEIDFQDSNFNSSTEYVLVKSMALDSEGNLIIISGSALFHVVNIDGKGKIIRKQIKKPIHFDTMESEYKIAYEKLLIKYKQFAENDFYIPPLKIDNLILKNRRDDFSIIYKNSGEEFSHSVKNIQYFYNLDYIKPY